MELGHQYRLVVATEQGRFLRELEALSQDDWRPASAPARWPLHAMDGDTIDLEGDPKCAVRHGFACLVSRNAFDADLKALERRIDADARERL